MEGLKNTERSMSVEEFQVDEFDSMSRFGGGVSKTIGVGCLAMSLAACGSVSRVGGSVTTTSGPEGSRTHSEWHDSTKGGEYREICNLIEGEGVRATGEFTGVHTYKNGEFTYEKVKLPNGRMATIRITGPDGTVYNCK